MFTAILIAVAAATTAAAAPAGKGPSHLPVTRRTVAADAVVRDGWVREQALYTRAKYATYLPPRERVALRRELRRGVGESEVDSLVDFGRDDMYSVAVSIGTPPQVFEMQIDTGSGDTYVYDSGCVEGSCAGDGAGTRYSSGSSSTFKSPTEGPTSGSLQYGAGWAEGYWALDEMMMAGEKVKGHEFLAVTRTDGSFDMTNTTGLVGFAWPRMALGGEPYWHRLAQTWNDKRFAIRLARAPAGAGDGDSNPGGQLTLGGVDEGLYKGEVDYNPLTSKDFWRIDLAATVVNGHRIDTGDQPSAIIDTGATLIVGPPDAVEALYANVPGAKPSTEEDEEDMYTLPCDADFTMALEFATGKQYALDRRDLVYRQKDREDGMCLGAVYGVDFGQVHWILGDAFLKSIYTVFRYEPAAVGFAQLR